MNTAEVKQINAIMQRVRSQKQEIEAAGGQLDLQSIRNMAAKYPELTETMSQVLSEF